MKNKENIEKIKHRKPLKGFTLVELIVVIAIIGILAAILVPTLMGRVKDAKIKAANDGAAKLAEYAAIVITDMETNGLATSYSNGLYGAFDDNVNELSEDDEFRKELLKVFPTLENNCWVVSFDNHGSIDAAVYWERGSIMGTYPVTDLTESDGMDLASLKLGKDSAFTGIKYQMEMAINQIKEKGSTTN